MRRCHERLRKVGRVVECRRDDQPCVTIGFVRPIEELGEDGSPGVGHSVPAHISGTHAGGEYFHRAGELSRWIRASSTTSAARRRDALPFCNGLPRGDRLTLPLRLPGGRLRTAKPEQPYLLPVVGLELQRRLVLPQNTEPNRHPHDAASPKCAALLAGGD